MPGLYTACDVLVHPYRGEGFALPVLEAFAAFDQTETSNDAVGPVAHSGKFGAFEVAFELHRSSMHRAAIPSILGEAQSTEAVECITAAWLPP